MLNKILPAPGAARYFAWSNSEGGYSVFMRSTDNCLSEVETNRTLEAAEKRAELWQIKENKAVNKALEQGRK
jgi:hypothetical protein